MHNMKSVFIILTISLSILAFAEGLSLKKCDRVCTKIYKPVCAVLKKGSRTTTCTFANKCIFDNFRCRQNQPWKILDKNKKCKQDSCNCKALLKSN